MYDPRVVGNIDRKEELAWSPMLAQLHTNYEQFRPTGYNDIDTSAPTVPQRRRTLYAKIFARDDLLSARPDYFNTPGIPPSDVKRIARFKMGSHYLSSVTRVCTRCHSTHRLMTRPTSFSTAIPASIYNAIQPSTRSCTSLLIT
jgi:hypothetical protein